MDCEQLAPLYEEYALGVLEGEERAEIEAHLARACPHCTSGIEKARWVVAQLARMSPEAQPPRSLKGKILDAIKSSGNVAEFAKTPPNRATFPVWAWAAAAALAILTGYSIRQIGNQDTQLAELRREMKIATLQNNALQNQLEVGRQVASVMMSPDSMPLKLIPKDKNMPMNEIAMLAVTEEPAGGSPQPTTAIAWSAQVN